MGNGPREQVPGRQPRNLEWLDPGTTGECVTNYDRPAVSSDLFLLRRLGGKHVLDSAAPAEMRHVDDHPVGVTELHFVEGGRRVGVRAPHEVAAAGLLDLLLGLGQIVDPEPEM